MVRGGFYVAFCRGCPFGFGRIFYGESVFISHFFSLGLVIVLVFSFGFYALGLAVWFLFGRIVAHMGLFFGGYMFRKLFPGYAYNFASYVFLVGF